MADPNREDSGHQTGWAEKSHEDAQAGNIDEHAMTVRDALMNHRWAVVWSLTVSMSVIMEAFQKQFGEDHGGESGYQVAAAWRNIPWGIFATIGPAYASEILPLALRSYLTAYVNMCFAIGQFIGAGVIQGLLKRNDEWSYRIPFAVQWVWPVPLFVICLFMPESPWWLVQKGRLEEAEHVLRQVTCGPQRDKAPQTLAMMVHTNGIEHEIEVGSSYLDCFRSSHRRRTEIACVSFAGQVLAGSQFAYSGTYFFQQAGMGADDAYKLGLGGTAIAFVGTILSWFLMRRIGRRTIYLCGMSGIVAYLFTIGVLTTASPQHRRSPMGWTIPAEVSSTRLRAKTICLSRNGYYLTLLWANILEPYMVNPTSWDWRGYTGFFWCGWAALTLAWAFFRLVETKDRTFEELDLMFAAGVPTRRFATYHVDAYAEDLAVKDRVVDRDVAKKKKTEA
ncbi:alpha-glucoside transport [Apiospora rasikravindrae]|uniref:Alpha-glucoside transport n=1 Tax=Apiospora rasikravindrae TaxID=990691 RepID=A0ABR1S0M8_9PEZI